MIKNPTDANFAKIQKLARAANFEKQEVVAPVKILD
jgi:hypothetical protein